MADLNENDCRLLDRLAEKVVKLQMTTPAIFMLETAKPLNNIGSQMLVFFGPVLSAFFNSKDIYRLSDLLEHREVIEEIIVRIEKQDEERYNLKREEKLKRKKAKAQEKGKI